MTKKSASFVILFLLLCAVSGSGQVHYSLTYSESSPDIVSVSIRLSKERRGPIKFIMPRSIPGHYSATNYDQFVEALTAVSSSGERAAMVRDSTGAPRWSSDASNNGWAGVDYNVNFKRMEERLTPSDASIRRPGFAGIFNYSVFGWIDGTELERVECTVKTPDAWPIFTTERPSSALTKGSLTFPTGNYYELADGQIFIGPRFRLKQFEGPVPLFIVSYAETEDEYLDDYGKQGVMSMNILKEYFGELPFKQYSIMLRKAVPLEASSAPALAMEHLQSSTFFGGTADLRKSAMNQQELMRTMPTYLHHMAHAFIPLRSYGDAYRPYVQEIPPIINNIWFNEGFMWFIAYDQLKLEAMKTRWVNNTVNADPVIKRMNLEQLSQAASTMYGNDFRLGMGIYSRGAMMAIEMDAHLKEKSGGTKSVKDVLRYLSGWSKQNKRAFTMAEFPALIDRATGIGISHIYEKWRLPLK
jgi:predicted metalloprotease with PDZ domain